MNILHTEIVRATAPNKKNIALPMKKFLKSPNKEKANRESPITAKVA